MSDPIMDRAEELKNIMYERFTELKPTVDDYLSLLATSLATNADGLTLSDKDKGDYVTSLFKMISEKIARAEAQMAVRFLPEQVIGQTRRDIEADMQQILIEEKSQGITLN